jgi:uncharacterized protein YggT (Ycf19 family)
MDSFDSREDKLPYRYNKILWIVFSVIEFLLGFRFALKFMGSDPNTGLAKFIYKVTQPFASPFLKTLGVYKEEGSIFEWTTLIAMLVYWIVAWIIIKTFLTDDTVSTPESERKIK